MGVGSYMKCRKSPRTILENIVSLLSNNSDLALLRYIVKFHRLRSLMFTHAKKDSYLLIYNITVGELDEMAIPISIYLSSPGYTVTITTIVLPTI